LPQSRKARNYINVLWKKLQYCIYGLLGIGAKLFQFILPAESEDTFVVILLGLSMVLHWQYEKTRKNQEYPNGSSGDSLLMFLLQMTLFTSEAKYNEGFFIRDEGVQTRSQEVLTHASWIRQIS
jgi:hypothetical protein